MGLALWGWLWGWHYRYGAMGLTPQVPRGDPKSRRSPVPKHTEPQKEPRPVPPPRAPQRPTAPPPRALRGIFSAAPRDAAPLCWSSGAARSRGQRGGNGGCAAPHRHRPPHRAPIAPHTAPHCPMPVPQHAPQHVLCAPQQSHTPQTDPMSPIAGPNHPKQALCAP